jgi:hypothetical protein
MTSTTIGYQRVGAIAAAGVSGPPVYPVLIQTVLAFKRI